MNSITLKIERLSFYRFIALMFGLSLASFFLILPLLIYLEEKYPGGNHLSNINATTLIISALLFAPWVETYFFQTIPFKTLRKLKLNDSLIALISSTAFGMAHGSMAQKLSAFFGGLILCATYIFSEKRGENSFLNTSLIHGFINLFFISIGFIS